MNRDMRDYWFAVLQNELVRGSSSMTALIKATSDTAEVYDLRHNPVASAETSAVAAGLEPNGKAVDDEPPKSESAYLIERSNQGYPEWLYVSGEIFNWTRSSVEAIRFCRRVDAEQVAAVIGADVDRICQHQWGPDPNRVYFDNEEPWCCAACGGSFTGDLFEGQPCPGCRVPVDFNED